MNELAKLTTVIDAYVQARQQADRPLEGREEADFDWIATHLPQAAQHLQAGHMIRFNFLYGKLLGAATAFIEKYVLSEPRQ